MKKNRLLKLADFLDSVPRRKFNLGTWVQSMPKKPEAKREGSCGFAGCAVGWAVHAKLFRGLKFGEPDIGDEPNAPPIYYGYEGFEAIETLFEISQDDFIHLFVSSSYNAHRATPKQVSTRIRDFVANGGQL